MVSENRGLCWHSEFSRIRNLHDDGTLVDLKKKVDADGDELGIFMDSGVTDSQYEMEVLEDFCRGISLEDIESGLNTAGSRRAVWIDDREGNLELEGSGNPRQYENPLTATGLFRALKTPRYNHKALPDVTRRLIYVTDLDPACIHALAATASWHQTPVLRNAIYKHLIFQTSIAVKVPSLGFLTFQLDLHLPFFLLRKCTPPGESVGKTSTKPRRQWTNLSFLKLDISKSQEQEPKNTWGIIEAQISCVITGSDEWRWVGYSFVDAEIDGFLTDLFEEDLSFDQIACRALPTDMPIWRPRDYWLRVFEIRIEQVRKEWEYLIYKVELSVNQYVRSHTRENTELLTPWVDA
ncbi:hypothetical protein K469DRAFT_651442 [Zopfia rhizophila CBS 207.26]|uniref:Uncharacterized protein n=1 Tax=Zopfia rhizophila CBS 207.26 TaxID=1314779 RepID=A0A6A6ETB9_9PEZI|nr:hypothetical protein K469DRAFT_651442 [Zopfia rhizophila CBS 207.26]